MTGTYILVIYCEKAHKLTIGSLGELQFNKGFYLYIGSAMGKSGSVTLLNRLRRHLLPSHEKKLHWHIDYFLESTFTHIIRLYLIPSREKIECLIAEGLKTNLNERVKSFGSSDCRCETHLFYRESFKDISFKELK